jgi:hypothetical protein
MALMTSAKVIELSRMMRFKTVIAGFAAGVVLAATSATANTITINGGAGTFSCNGGAAGACLAFVGGGSPGSPTGLGTLSSTNADEYLGVPASASAEAARLNLLAGTSFSGTGALYDGNQTNGGGGDLTFSTLATWIVLKIGSDNVFIRNCTNGLLTIAFDAFSGQGSGLSHYSEFGAPSQVPLPAAVWLMGAGLAGLGFAGRKKSA